MWAKRVAIYHAACAPTILLRERRGFESELLPFSTVVEVPEALVVQVVVLMPVYIIWAIMPITYEHTPVVIILETLAEKIRSLNEKVASVAAQTRLV